LIIILIVVLVIVLIVLLVLIIAYLILIFSNLFSSISLFAFFHLLSLSHRFYVDSFLCLSLHELFLFSYQPLPIFGILIRALGLFIQLQVNRIERVRLPVRMNFNHLFSHIWHILIRCHNHHWNLCLRHSFLGRSSDIMFKTELENVLDFK